MSGALFLFFNDTATTEIYTYGHTLSLHDALPISTAAGPGAIWSTAAFTRTTIPNGRPREASGSTARRRAASTRPIPMRPAPRTARVLQPGAGARSDEHTSDLQSLMRTPYAVFCLTKKTNARHVSHTTLKNNH